MGPPPSCASRTDKSGVEAKDGSNDAASANNTPLRGGDDPGSDRDTVSADGMGASEERTGAGAKVGLLLELVVACTLDAPEGRARPSPTARDGSWDIDHDEEFGAESTLGLVRDVAKVGRGLSAFAVAIGED